VSRVTSGGQCTCQHTNLWYETCVQSFTTYKTHSAFFVLYILCV